MNNFKKIILAGLLSVALICAGSQIVSAQVSGQTIWKVVSGAIQPMVSSWTLGSATNRISKIWATAIDATSLTIAGISGNLDMGGFAISNAGRITGTNFVATSTTATSTFAGGFAVGTNQFIVQKATGNVGIGTTPAANQKTMILSGDGFTTLTVQNNGGGTGVLGALLVKGGSNVNNDSTRYIANFTASDDISRMMITNGGNVGIGTTAPTTKLQIGSDTTGSSNYLTLGKGFDVGSGINWKRAGVVDASIYSDAAEDLLFETDMTNIQTTGDFIFKTNGTSELVRIKSGGNVGIGTTAPYQKLDVTSTNVTSAFRVGPSGNNTVGLHQWYNSSNGAFYFDQQYNNDGGNIYFRTKVLGTPIDAMTILGSGNVGIGTSTPSSLLTVSAGATATTTAEFGDRYSATSKVCHNTKNTAGASISFYFVGTTMVVENNRCN